MDIRELRIAGAWEITPRQFGDNRGVFLEWFKSSAFTTATGRNLELAQANCSVSAAGSLRGIHFTDTPPGQAKYVTCVKGAFLDVIVDLRVGSPDVRRMGFRPDRRHRPQSGLPVRRPGGARHSVPRRRINRHVSLQHRVLPHNSTAISIHSILT